MAQVLPQDSHVAAPRFNADLIIGALQRLEQQLPILRCRALDLAEAVDNGDLAFSVLATEGTRRALDTITASTKSLKRQVVPADGIGNTLESLGELVIRAERTALKAVGAMSRSPPSASKGSASR